ncbi:MAG: hypothetical protein FJ303_23750, partial [Planctomycetes bacterium]|nr:hypothetical protein [Planctomycetota bacterium]
MRRKERTNGNGGTATLDDAPPLQAGDRLTRERFLRIWKQHPEIKFAELIGGVVYMEVVALLSDRAGGAPAPASTDRGRRRQLWQRAWTAGRMGSPPA